jgi:RND family efflux transporter MFP subunit
MNKSNSKIKAMKKTLKFVLPIAVLVIAAACAPTQENAELVQLEADKDRFKDSITAINAKIEALDTVNKKNFPKVTFHETAPTKFEHYFSVQGYVESARNILLTPEVGGLVRSIDVKEGQTVGKGMKIASFDAAIVSSNINELEEQLKLAQYNFDKQKRLFDQGVGNEFNLKQAEGQLNGLDKTMKTLETQRGKSTLTAPFSGYIEEIMPTVGEMSGPGMPVARLINMDEVYVSADISEIYLGRLNAQNQASVSFPALKMEVDSLLVNPIGKYINPANRTLQVKVNLPKNEKFIPNLVATITIRDYVKENALVVPSSSISQDSRGNDIVFVGVAGSENYKVKQIIVKTGLTYKGMTEILEGLDPQSKVINQGSQSVYDGLEVEELKL